MKLTNPVAGRWLKELRKAAGLDQYKVAELIGVSPGRLCELERAQSVPAEKSARIIEAIIAMRVRDKEFDAKVRELKSRVY